MFEHLSDSRDRKQAIFCVVHGGTDVELRTKSLEYLTTLPWDGYAIGGSLGEFSVFTPSSVRDSYYPEGCVHFCLAPPPAHTTSARKVMGEKS